MTRASECIWLFHLSAMLILATTAISFLAWPLLAVPLVVVVPLVDLARGASNFALASAHLGVSLGVGGAVAHDVSSALDLFPSDSVTCTDAGPAATAAESVAVATVCLQQEIFNKITSLHSNSNYI